MQQIFHEVCEHMSREVPYYEIFAEHYARMEGWVVGEIRFVLSHKPSRYRIKNLEVHKKRGEKYPDLRFTLNGEKCVLEVKSLECWPPPRDPFGRYFSVELAKEFKKLGDAENSYLFAVFYPLTIPSIITEREDMPPRSMEQWKRSWKMHSEKAKDKFAVQILCEKTLGNTLATLWTK